MLEGESYLSLATFRRDGRAVETAVWFAPDGDSLVVFSAGDAGKVKRLRNSARARVAACDVRGKVHGPWHDVRGSLFSDSADVARALAALHAKYGLMMWLADIGARLTGRYAKRQYIRLVPA
jgi:PPOX class probable F420-dependent enzyme